MKTMSVGMGLETRVHCLNGVICQTCVVIIITVTIRVLLYSFGLN
jgi:ferredoxin